MWAIALRRCRQYGTWIHFYPAYPGLSSWAIICRPSGAYLLFHFYPRLAPLRQAQGKLWAVFLRRFAAIARGTHKRRRCGPIDPGRRTAGGGCPHMSCDGVFPKWEFVGIYFVPGIPFGGAGCGIVQMVVETGAALAGRVFIWARKPSDRCTLTEKQIPHQRRALVRNDKGCGMTKVSE